MIIISVPLLIFSEIPLFYLLNAKIGFGNVNGSQVPVDGVRSTPSNDSIENTNLTQKCIIDASCFEPPSGYEIIGKLFLIELSSSTEFHSMQR